MAPIISYDVAQYFDPDSHPRIFYPDWPPLARSPHILHAELKRLSALAEFPKNVWREEVFGVYGLQDIYYYH